MKFDAQNAKRLIVLGILLAIFYLGGFQNRFQSPRQGDGAIGAGNSDDALASAFENHSRDVLVEGAGRVVRILPDDEEGTEHQKFILQLASGQKLLVAHNTDLAERVPQLKVGDTVEFRGEYEWNPQGGVLHWTHHDPRGRHADGWLKHNGQFYQ
jgi:hypothetical protein